MFIAGKVPEAAYCMCFGEFCHIESATGLTSNQKGIDYFFALKKQNRDVCKNPVKAIFWMDFCTWGGFLFLAWLRFMSLGQLQCVFRSSVLFWLVFFSPVRNISYCHEFKWQLFREIGCFLKIFVNMQTKEICTAVLVSVWRNSHRWEWGSLQKFTSGIRQKVLRISDTGLFWRICAAVVLPVLI